MTAKKSRKHKADSEDRPAPDPEQQTGEEIEAPEAAEQVRDESDTLRAERDSLLDRLQRVSADYLNYQKRAQRDLEQARQFANEELIKSLLGVLDDMELALGHARANHGEGDPLLAGMQLVHDKALKTLGKFGLELIEAAGQPFDPERHAAVMQEPSADHPSRTVLRELQRGYQLKGRTIRPAAVVVSTVPEAEPGEAQPDRPEVEADETPPQD